MKQLILDILEKSLQVKRQFIEGNVDTIIKCADMMAKCISSGNKILIFGNGGSAADAQHLAAEFVNRFKIERPPLAAIALTTDTSLLTSIGNDYDFGDIFFSEEFLFRRDRLPLRRASVVSSLLLLFLWLLS